MEYNAQLTGIVMRELETYLEQMETIRNAVKRLQVTLGEQLDAYQAEEVDPVVKALVGLEEGDTDYAELSAEFAVCTEQVNAMYRLTKKPV